MGWNYNQDRNWDSGWANPSGALLLERVTDRSLTGLALQKLVGAGSWFATTPTFAEDVAAFSVPPQARQTHSRLTLAPVHRGLLPSPLLRRPLSKVLHRRLSRGLISSSQSIVRVLKASSLADRQRLMPA